MSTKRYMRANAGATVIEYCFLALLVAIVAVAAVGRIGVGTAKSYDNPLLKQALQTQ